MEYSTCGYLELSARTERTVSSPTMRTYLANIVLGQRPPHRPTKRSVRWVGEERAHSGRAHVRACVHALYDYGRALPRLTKCSWLGAHILNFVLLWSYYRFILFQNPTLWRVLLWMTYLYYYGNVFTEKIASSAMFTNNFFPGNQWFVAQFV